MVYGVNFRNTNHILFLYGICVHEDFILSCVARYWYIKISTLRWTLEVVGYYHLNINIMGALYHFASFCYLGSGI